MGHFYLKGVGREASKSQEPEGKRRESIEGGMGENLVLRSVVEHGKFTGKGERGEGVRGK